MARSEVRITKLNERALVITEDDLERLEKLIDRARFMEPRGSEYLDSLECELAAARVVASSAIPPDIVTMNSRVQLLDLDTAERMTFTLVFPDEADVDNSKLSVLAPIGTAVLGYRAGDTLSWQVPDGIRRLKVVEVLYQPEASGNGHSQQMDERPCASLPGDPLRAQRHDDSKERSDESRETDCLDR